MYALGICTSCMYYFYVLVVGTNCYNYLQVQVLAIVGTMQVLVLFISCYFYYFYVLVLCTSCEY